MNKKVIVTVAIVVVVAAIAVAAVVANKDDNVSSNQAQDQATNQAQEQTQTSSTISELLSSSKAQQCKLNTTNEGVDVAGDMYFADGKLRADYTSTKDGKTTNGSMIILADKQYVWDVDGKKGVSFAFSGDQIESQSSNIQDQTGFDVAKRYDFTCESWDVDQSKFTPPADVQFTDFTNLQNQLQQLQAN